MTARSPSREFPRGDWRLTIFDQWNDQIVDGISTPVRVGSGNVNLGEIAVHAWKQNLYTRTCFRRRIGDLELLDTLMVSVRTTSQASRWCRPTSASVTAVSPISTGTDLKVTPGSTKCSRCSAWYMLETDSNRYKNTGTHVINDAGGPADGTASCGAARASRLCGTSTNRQQHGQDAAKTSRCPALAIPGSVYCDNADRSGKSIQPCRKRCSGPRSFHRSRRSTPGSPVTAGRALPDRTSSSNSAKSRSPRNENGGIRGHVVYASTRPFDDPALLLQLSWDADGSPCHHQPLPEGNRAGWQHFNARLVDTTTTSSWDDWAVGFRSDGVHQTS